MPVLNQYRLIDSKQDGNCAFNAFAMGLRDLICSGLVLPEAARDKLLQEFNKAKPNLSKINWLALKDHLFSLDIAELQNQMSPVLRTIACDLLLAAEIEEDGAEITTLKQNFMATFFYEFEKEIGLAGNNSAEDDIFCRHPRIKDFFQEKIAELKNQYYEKYTKTHSWGAYMQFCGMPSDWAVRSEYLKERNNTSEDTSETENLIPLREAMYLGINEEWHTSYRNIFFDEMKKDTAWAGDMELAILAKYFGINLCIRSRGWKFLVTEQVYADKDAPYLLLTHRVNHYSYWQPNDQAYLQRIQALRKIIDKKLSLKSGVLPEEVDELNQLSAFRDPQLKLFRPPEQSYSKRAR